MYVHPSIVYSPIHSGKKNIHTCNSSAVSFPSAKLLQQLTKVTQTFITPSLPTHDVTQVPTSGAICSTQWYTEPHWVSASLLWNFVTDTHNDNKPSKTSAGHQQFFRRDLQLITHNDNNPWKPRFQHSVVTLTAAGRHRQILPWKQTVTDTHNNKQQNPRETFFTMVLLPHLFLA